MSGVQITGKIKPLNGAPFPVFEDIDGQGGFRTVATIADRNLVSAAPLYCKAGMLVYVQAVQCMYELGEDLTTWRFFAPSPALASQAHWYVNTTTGNDNNDGSIGAPLATYPQLALRLFPNGAECLLTQDVTIHLTGTFVSVFMNVGSADGAVHTMTLEGAITSSASITLSAVVQPQASSATRGQLTTLSGTFVSKERIRLTSGASSGAIAYSTGLNAGAQNTFVSLFLVPTFAAFHLPSPAAAGDTCVVDTLSVLISRLQVNAAIRTRVVIKDVQIIRAIVNGVNSDTPSSDAGGNVLFSGCVAVSTAGYWQCNAGGANIANCRWATTTRTTLKGAGWLIFGCVAQGILGVSDGSVHSYGFTLDGGQLVLGTDGDPNGSPNYGSGTFVANRSYLNAGSIEAENGSAVTNYRGAAVYVGPGSKLVIGDFIECQQWGASGAFPIGYYVEPGGHIFQANPAPGTILANFAIPSTVNLNIGGLEFAYSDNPISIPNEDCGLIAINSNAAISTQTDGGFYLTGQSGNHAIASFPGLTKAGMYRVSGYIATTTADGAAVGLPSLNAIFTDDSGVSRTVAVATATSVVALGGAGGEIIIESNATQIQWSVTGVVTPGAALYSVRCRIEKISNGA